MLLVLIFVLCVILTGSLGSVLLSPGGTRSSSSSSVEQSTTLTQTAVIISTDIVNSVSTETTSTTAVVTSTSMVSPPSSTQSSSSHSTISSPITSTSTISTTASTIYATTSSKISSTTSSESSSVSSSSSFTQTTFTFTPLTTSSSHTTTSTFTTSSSSSSTTLAAIVMSLSCTPSTLTFGILATCTAKVSDSSSSTSVPTGTVSFSSTLGGTFLHPSCTLIGSGSSSSCLVEFSPSPSSSGQNVISASYAGDSLHSGGSSSFNLLIGIATSTSVTCSPVSIAVTTRTNCTVAENSTGLLAPTGAVSFADDKAGAFNPPTCNLDPSGRCSVAYTPNSGSEGSATITANYAGNQNYPASSGETQLAVTQIPTHLQLTCNPNTVTVNQTSSCDVTVQDATPGTNINPSGSVTVNSNLGSSSCILGGNQCVVSFTPKSTSAGLIVVQAIYGGDTDHSSSSGNATISIMERKTTVNLNCNPNNLMINQPTSCTTTVNGGGPGPAGTPTGSVSVSSDFESETCTLSPAGGSSAQCSVTMTPGPGTLISQHMITATYSGDSVFGSSEQTMNLNVNQRPVTSSVTCSPNPVTHNTSTVCVITVTDSGNAGSPVTPTGVATFQSSPPKGSFSSSSCTLRPTGTTGKASCSVSFTAASPGNFNIMVNYSGDSDHQSSNAQTKLSSN